MAHRNLHEPHRSQADVFLGGEGDRWYERNRETLSSTRPFPDISAIKRDLSFRKDSIKHILEVGCGSGEKLEDLCDFFGAVGKGIDPSKTATSEGNSRFLKLSKHATLNVGTASELPFANESFDLVYFGFCLCLIDREDINEAILEADRVLKPGGFIAIYDFDPGVPMKVPYHHHAGLYSYKEDYAQLFRNIGYYLISRQCFSHVLRHFDQNKKQRLAVNILFKELAE